MSSAATPSRISSSTSAPTISASARSPPASSSRTAPFGGRVSAPPSNSPRSRLVQRRPRGRRVVLGALVQRDHLGQRRQLVHRRRAAGQRVPSGLVRERHPHVGLGQAPQGLHRVELRARQLVEAVHEHRPPPPRARVGAERVEHRPRLAIAVGAPERLEAPAVGGVERRQLVGVPDPAPRPQRAGEARRLDQRPLQLREQRARRPREPRRRRRRREHPQMRVADRRPHDALARDHAQRPRRHARDPPDLPPQPREGQHLGAEHDLARREARAGSAPRRPRSAPPAAARGAAPRAAAPARSPP